MSLPQKTFEDYAYENGMRYWWATEFAEMLGYATMSSFMNAVNKAIQSCMSAKISHFDDFVKAERIVDGKKIDDFKLSRFACYMIAMNADVKKEQVARAQSYFAKQAEQIDLLLEGRNDMERLQIREEIKSGNTALNSVASRHGVVNFAKFHDAGYRGLYNKGIGQVKKHKGIKRSADHFDFMGRTELAANLFRITLTEERLKNSPSTSSFIAENIHNKVGKQVRKMVKENTGMFPEQLESERRLGEVKKELKKATKKLNSKEDDQKDEE